MIITTGKSEFLYDSIFIDIKKIIMDSGYKIEEIPNRIICDFEKSLQNAIRKNFKNSIIDGCFFHFVKLLWGKAKFFGLCKKNILKILK